jgi:hypothetical protein
MSAAGLGLASGPSGLSVSAPAPMLRFGPPRHAQESPDSFWAPRQEARLLAHPPAPVSPAKGAAGRIQSFLDGTAEAAAAPARHLVGKLLLRKGDRLVVEVDAGAGLDWAIPAAVRVFFADGTSALATVDLRGTTRAAKLQPGQHLRLAVQLAAAGSGFPGAGQDSPAPVRIELAGPAGAVSIELRA